MSVVAAEKKYVAGAEHTVRMVITHWTVVDQIRTRLALRTVGCRKEVLYANEAHGLVVADLTVRNVAYTVNASSLADRKRSIAEATVAGSVIIADITISNEVVADKACWLIWSHEIVHNAGVTERLIQAVYTSRHEPLTKQTSSQIGSHKIVNLAGNAWSVGCATWTVSNQTSAAIAETVIDEKTRYASNASWWIVASETVGHYWARTTLKSNRI